MTATYFDVIGAVHDHGLWLKTIPGIRQVLCGTTAGKGNFLVMCYDGMLTPENKQRVVRRLDGIFVYWYKL
jgi:hypothetical protein